MFKKLLLSAIILAPSSLVFGIGGSSKSLNICYEIGTDYDRCLEASATCFWDEEDGRCEPINEPPGCGRIKNRTQCNNSPIGCFWDDEDGRCERVGD